MSPVLTVLLLGLGSWFAAGPLLAARPSSTAPDRTALAVSLLTALLGVVLTRFLVPWGSLPPLLWALPVALAAAGVLAAARRWPALPVLESPRPRLRALRAAAEAAVTALLLAVIIGV